MADNNGQSPETTIAVALNALDELMDATKDFHDHARKLLTEDVQPDTYPFVEASIRSSVVRARIVFINAGINVIEDREKARRKAAKKAREEANG